MSGHTPGPWVHYAARLRPQYPLRINEIHGPKGETIVRWSGFDGVGKKRTVTANARLIAAAPVQHAELLACKQFLEDMHTQTAEWTVAESQKRHAAVCADITAATGEKV